VANAKRSLARYWTRTFGWPSDSQAADLWLRFWALSPDDRNRFWSLVRVQEDIFTGPKRRNRGPKPQPERDKAIALAALRGQSKRDIARDYDLSPRTVARIVDRYSESMFGKIMMANKHLLNGKE
jgi:hypothetical protein